MQAQQYAYPPPVLKKIAPSKFIRRGLKTEESNTNVIININRQSHPTLPRFGYH